MRKFFAVVFLFFLVVSVFAGCTVRNSHSESTFYAMNTFVTIHLSAMSEQGERISEVRLAEIYDECKRIVFEIESAASVTVIDSDTARVNASGSETIPCGEHFLALITKALEIADKTDGAFSPTLRVLSDLWDVTGVGYVPTDTEIAEALLHSEYTLLTVTEEGVMKNDPMLQVDFGGIAKGYAAELLVAYLDTTEVSGGLVSLGGNVGLFGKKTDSEPYKIGLTDPRTPGEVLGYLDIPSGFVSVSGDYERYFEKDGVRYHHILDSKTGAPSRSGLASAAVVSEDGALADALSTALFVMGVEDAISFYENSAYDFEAVLVTDGGRVILTQGLSEHFTLASEAYAVQTSLGGVHND